MLPQTAAVSMFTQGLLLSLSLLLPVGPETDTCCVGTLASSQKVFDFTNCCFLPHLLVIATHANYH